MTLPLQRSNKCGVTEPFEYKNCTKEEMVQQINDQYPISLKLCQDLVERVSARYPIISKAEVALVIKGFFQGIRKLLVMGYIINIIEIFYDFKLFFFIKNGIKKNETRMKVRVKTPKDLKYLDKPEQLAKLNKNK